MEGKAGIGVLKHTHILIVNGCLHLSVKTLVCSNTGYMPMFLILEFGVHRIDIHSSEPNPVVHKNAELGGCKHLYTHNFLNLVPTAQAQLCAVLHIHHHLQNVMLYLMEW